MQADSKVITRTHCPWCESDSLDIRFETKDRSGSGECFPIVACESCGFIFTQDVPAPEEIAPYYEFEQYISHSDTKSNLTDRAYHWVRSRMLRRKQQIILKHYTGNGPGTILDFGSGTGYFLHHMVNAGWIGTGVEISEVARQHSIEKFGLKVFNPDDFEEVNGPFDVITLWHVLEHLYDFKEKLQSFCDLLIDGGLLVLALPNHQAYDARILKQNWAAYDTPRHLWHFTPEIIQSIADTYGLSYEKTYAMPFDAFYVSILSYQLKHDNSFALLKGGVLGLLSNLSCTFNPEKASSVIYILRK